jgi:hypothetical protein
MLRTLSLAVAVVTCGAACTASPSPSDDVDAAPEEVDGAVFSELPDMGGDWLVRARANLTGEFFFNFRGTIVFTRVTDNTAELDLVLQPLDFETLEPVGDPIVGSTVDVRSDGSFDWPMVGVIPDRCNSITQATVNIDAVVHGNIRDADFQCGGLTGTAGVLDLDGMTYGGVRIAGDALPAPVHACP